MDWYKLSKKGVKYNFSSTQVQIPKDLADEILEWSKKNIPNDILYTEPKSSSYGRENDIHITVKYGIHSPDADSIKSIVESESIIEGKLDEISRFTTDERYDVLKIEVESEGLQRLNKLIAESTECTDTHPTYKSHITLAYVQKNKGKDLVGDKKFAGRKFKVDFVRFSSKNGDKTNIKLKSSSKRVFLGGTCAGSDWRKDLISKLEISYFNPVVEDWNEEAQKREIEERKTCDFVLYTITSDMKGVYSIAEVVDDSNKRPKKTVLCVLKKGFDKAELKSLGQVEKMVQENGGKVFDNLKAVAEFLNG